MCLLHVVLASVEGLLSLGHPCSRFLFPSLPFLVVVLFSGSIVLYSFASPWTV